MRHTSRLIALLALVLFIGGLVHQIRRPLRVNEASASSSVSSNRGADETHAAEDPRMSNGEPAGSARTTSSGPSDTVESADASSPTYESPLLRALGAVVDQNEQVFGGAAEEIDTTLAEGDRILSAAKVSNREAIRQANRQVRLPGRSPHLLVVLVQGLAATDLGCYGNTNAATPHVDSLSAAGSRLTRFAVRASSNLVRSTDGSASADSSASGDTDAASFGSFQSGRTPRVLWDSGYTTCLLGDRSSAWTRDDSWDHLYGWNSRLPSAFPETVTSNRVTLRLSRDAKSPGTRFDQMLVDEAASYLSDHASRRPVALVVATPLDWWQAIDADASRVDVVNAWDGFFGKLIEVTDRTVGTGRTIVMLVGTSRPTAEDKLELTESGVPLVLAWPGHIPAGNVIDRPAGFDDLLPTIARLIGSTRAK